MYLQDTDHFYQCLLAVTTQLEERLFTMLSIAAQIKLWNILWKQLRLVVPPPLGQPMGEGVVCVGKEIGVGEVCGYGWVIGYSVVGVEYG